MVETAEHLERDEELELARRAGAGDQAAVDRLVASHLKFVEKIARGYGRTGVPMTDLIQEGVIGFVQAVRRFNPDKNARLSTYARWWIRAAIQDHVVRSWSLVRMSTTSAQKSLFLNLRRMTNELRDGADAIGDDLAQRLADRFGTTATDVLTMARRITQRDQSLDVPVGGDSGEHFVDLLNNGEESQEDRLVREGENRMLSDLIAMALAALPDREAFIIRNRYFSEARSTFAALGTELGLSKDRVRQLEARALESLRHFLEPLLKERQIAAE